MDTGMSPLPWRDVQLCDMSPGRDISGGGGGWMETSKAHGHHHLGCVWPMGLLELQGEGGTGAMLGYEGQ